jgi:hypothetical protein
VSAFGARYVIDNNTLNQLSRPQKASKHFRDNVHIPDEVLYEARESSDIADLRHNRYPTTQSVLTELVRVMANVPVDDTKLIDLYANQGNADPLIVACALDGENRDSQYLDAPEWIVVTSDKALRAKAEQFELRVITNSEFAALIDGAEDGIVL